jgi:hypothetical protein
MFHNCSFDGITLALEWETTKYRNGSNYWTAVQYLLLVFAIFEVLQGPMQGGNQQETAIKGTLNHTKAFFSTEICAGAMITGLQCLPRLR